MNATALGVAPAKAMSSGSPPSSSPATSAAPMPRWPRRGRRRAYPYRTGPSSNGKRCGPAWAEPLLGGELADAEALSIRGVEAGREAGAPPAVVEFTFAGLVWCIRAVQGRLAELEPLFGMVRALPDRPAWSFASEAQLACEPGNRDGAGSALAEAVARGLLQAPRTLGWTTTMSGAADVCAALEDRALAASLYELLAPCADVMTMQSGPLGRAAGRLALTLGRRDEAEAHLRAAVTLCERMDARAFLAIARYDLGRLLLPSPEGTALVEQARAMAEELGMPGWSRRAHAALAGLDASHVG